MPGSRSIRRSPRVRGLPSAVLMTTVPPRMSPGATRPPSTLMSAVTGGGPLVIRVVNGRSSPTTPIPSMRPTNVRSPVAVVGTVTRPANSPSFARRSEPLPSSATGTLWSGIPSPETSARTVSLRSSAGSVTASARVCSRTRTSTV